MQIFSVDQIIQMVISTLNINSMLFGAVLNAVGVNIITISSQLWASLLSADIKSVVVFGFMLFSMIIFGYRLVRKKLFGSIMYLIKN